MPSMNSGSSTALLLFFLFRSAARAQDCSASTPVFVDLHNRAISGTSDFEYGLFIGVGTPSQNQSLWPSLEHNETTFADSNFCSSTNTAVCKNHTHGFYDPQQSTTFKSDPNFKFLDVGDNIDSEISATGTDVLNVYTHYFDPSPPNVTFIDNFPVTILTNYTSNLDPFFGRGGAVGLGSSSTILQQLTSAGNILSRCFGLYIGTAFDRAGGVYNGSIVFGGYDAGRLSTPIYNYTMNPSTSTTSPFQVHVSQMTITFPNGSTTNLITDSGFDAALTTSQYDLTLPAAVTTTFANALKATPSNNNDNSLQLTAAFQGTFSITLSSKQTITYPSTWLSNTSFITPISATPLTNISSNFKSGPYILGTAFLSELYLIAQYSSSNQADSSQGTFHLAPAIQNALYVQTSPLCEGIPITPISLPKLSHFATAGLAGAIVGGIIGGSFLTITGWVLFRKFVLQPRFSSSSPSSNLDSDDFETTKPYKLSSDVESRGTTSLKKQQSNRLKRKLNVRFLSPKPTPTASTTTFSPSQTQTQAPSPEATTKNKTQPQVTVEEMEMSSYPPQTSSALPTSTTTPPPHRAPAPLNLSLSSTSLSLSQQFAALPTPSYFSEALDSPMWPSTPAPLLSEEQRAQAHGRRGSDDLRRELGLKVVTTEMGKTGEKSVSVRDMATGGKKGRVKVGEVPTKGRFGRRETSALRRIFPA